MLLKLSAYCSVISMIIYCFSQSRHIAWWSDLLCHTLRHKCKNQKQFFQSILAMCCSFLQHFVLFYFTYADGITLIFGLNCLLCLSYSSLSQIPRTEPLQHVFCTHALIASQSRISKHWQQKMQLTHWSHIFLIYQLSSPVVSRVLQLSK